MSDALHSALTIFSRVIAKNELASWEAFESECFGDADLEASVRRLYDVDIALQGGSVEDRTAHLARHFSIGIAAASHSIATEELDLSGSLVDGYQLIERIGTGGMGEVYRARNEAAGFKHEVALKLMRPMAEFSGGLERFENERRLLAQLKHPNIAALYDGGYTDSNHPYFILELIEGRSIDRYIEDESVSLEGVLEIFTTICDAVQFAHSQLIVHRDLKPSNVLIDSTGRAKLLDFGIAKEIAMDSADSTVAMDIALTPNFASPEQLLGQPIGTSSDVYSLGALLFSLLTGRPPHDMSGVNPPEVLHIASDVSAPKASDSVSTAKASWKKALTGDLDTILAKALEKDVGQRYGSVDQLVDDVRRFLNGEPIHARPRSVSYRTLKFVKRNSVIVAAGAIVLASLIGALYYTTEQNRLTNQALTRSQATSRFLAEILSAPNTNWNSTLKAGQSASMPEILALAAEKLVADEHLAPATKVELYMALGLALQTWDDLDKSLDATLLAVEIARTDLPPEHPLQERARFDAAIALDLTRDQANAELSTQLLTEALEWIETYAPNDLVRRAGVISEFGYNAHIKGENREAIRIYHEALNLALDNGYPPVSPRVALAYGLIARSHEMLGEFEHSMTYLEKSINTYEEVGGSISSNERAFMGHMLRHNILRTDLPSAFKSAEARLVRTQSDPQDVWSNRDLYSMAAYIFVRAGELTKANEVLNLLDKAKPSEVNLRTLDLSEIARGAWWVANNNPNEGLVALELGGQRRAPENALFSYYVNLGAANVANGDFEAAELALKNAADNHPPMLLDNSVLGQHYQNVRASIEEAVQSD